MSSPDLLIIFIKAPRIGEVKTRLARDIGAENAQKLYRAMVEDLLQNLRGPDNFDLLITLWPENAEPEVRNWLNWKGQITTQSQGNLGDKLQHAFGNGFAQGYQRIVIIGSDLPELSSSVINDSFKQLHTYSLILGPATDGGYYLIGLRSPHTELFTGINWSTSDVLKKTLENADKAGLHHFLLPDMQDIDKYDDIWIRWKELKNSKKENLSKTMLVLQSILDKA